MEKKKEYREANQSASSERRSYDGLTWWCNNTKEDDDALCITTSIEGTRRKHSQLISFAEADDREHIRYNK